MLLLVVRGGTDWSGAFTALWYGLWFAAIGLAVAAILASSRTGISTNARVIGIVLGVSTLGLSALLFLAIASLASSVVG